MCPLYPPPPPTLGSPLNQTLTVLCHVVTDWLSGKHRDGPIGSVYEIPQTLNGYTRGGDTLLALNIPDSSSAQEWSPLELSKCYYFHTSVEKVPLTYFIPHNLAVQNL